MEPDAEKPPDLDSDLGGVGQRRPLNNKRLQLHRPLENKRTSCRVLTSQTKQLAAFHTASWDETLLQIIKAYCGVFTDTSRILN